MIHTYYIHDKRIILAIYDGAVDTHHIADYEQFIHHSFAQLNSNEKIINLTDLSYGRIVNSNITQRMAKLTEQYQSLTEMIYISGLSPFTRILFQSYLRLTGGHKIHTLSKQPFNELCDSFRVFTPEVYYKLKYKDLA